MLDNPNTLHLRCGSDIRDTLKEAGFVGAFLEFADPFCQGPVRDLSLNEFIEERAEFIAKAYKIPFDEVLARQKSEYHALSTIQQYDHVILWFEHDSYDQLILAYILGVLSRQEITSNIEIISINDFPGIDKFIGLGQLAPDQLSELWKNNRKLVTSTMIEEGAEVWQALIDPSLEKLVAQSKKEFDALPFRARALTRHLQELPVQPNGLGLTQQLILEIVADNGPIQAGQIFQKLMLEREPLPFLGDAMFEYVLEEMQKKPDPIFEVIAENDDTPWFKKAYSLNSVCRDFGQKL